MQAVALAVVDGDPVAVDLGHTVGATRVEGRGFALRHFAHLAEHFAARCLVEAYRGVYVANGVQQAGDAQRGHVAGEDWLRPRGLHEALGSQVVDLVGLTLLQSQLQRSLVEHVAGDEVQPVLNVLDAAEVDGAGAPYQAEDLIPLFEQEFGQIGTILAGDTGDQCAFTHGVSAPAVCAPPAARPKRARQSLRVSNRLCSKGICGVQPVRARSLVASPTRRGTSDGRIRAGS
ncbi:MAG: hypothetical protein KatS3mg051_0108 [Anaerolineae bacterium]|nr:MAG: hypothetical protein KatS3mg051_0108 [Anaerolineae bacterium]